MTNIIDKQLNRMISLMGNRTINESAKKAQDPVEYSTMGPDGNYYGIVREGANYYIKQAKPNEKGQLVKESFDFIGGFNARKANEYKSFASAMRNLEGKMYSLKEAIDRNATLVECNTDKSKSKKIIIEAQGQMRADIKRQLQIMNNSQTLDESRAGYKSANTLVEDKVVKATPFEEDENADPHKQYKEKVVKGGNTIIGKFNGSLTKESRKPKYIFESDELDDDVNLGDEDDIDIEEETPMDDIEMEVGDGLDADNELESFDDEEIDGGDMENDFEDTKKTIYISPEELENGFEIEVVSSEGNEDEMFSADDDLYGDDEDGLFDEEGDELGGDDELDLEDENEEELPMESFRRRGRRINETRINFGRHPRYLAKPFTLPKAHSQYANTTNWHDESVDNEQEPFTDKQRYKYFQERPKSVQNSLGLEESFRRNSKKKIR